MRAFFFARGGSLFILFFRSWDVEGKKLFLEFFFKKVL